MFCSLAPTAGRIVVLIGLFFNRHGIDVGVCPLVQFVTVEGYALFPDGEFADMRTDGVLKYLSAHAEICGRCRCADEARCGL
ncbi:hypothetical protein H097_10347 [Pseudomonas sp. FH4]|nr:hypothetical protein H097_10347 [Pseudomonas sp. FH4]